MRLIVEIDAHQGGFTIADKSETVETFLTQMEWAIQGFTHTKDLQTDLEVLRLAFEEGLQDKAIAKSKYKKQRIISY